VKVCSRIRPARVDGASAAVEEPMLPVPAERFLTEPVTPANLSISRGDE
jgi:hypothetical protein